jgi:hypothetical protein
MVPPSRIVLYLRIDRAANYGVLEGLARQRINTKLIAQNWDDFFACGWLIEDGGHSADPN